MYCQDSVLKHERKHVLSASLYINCHKFSLLLLILSGFMLWLLALLMVIYAC